MNSLTVSGDFWGTFAFKNCFNFFFTFIDINTNYEELFLHLYSCFFDF